MMGRRDRNKTKTGAGGVVRCSCEKIKLTKAGVKHTPPQTTSII